MQSTQDKSSSSPNEKIPDNCPGEYNLAAEVCVNCPLRVRGVNHCPKQEDKDDGKETDQSE